jgi:hypothetical protein
LCRDNINRIRKEKNTLPAGIYKPLSQPVLIEKYSIIDYLFQKMRAKFEYEKGIFIFILFNWREEIDRGELSNHKLFD